MEMILEYDGIFRKVSDFIAQKNTRDGRKADLPKLEESHSKILFASWDSHLKEAEKKTTDLMVTENNVIENINGNLHSSNLVAESILGFLPNAKQLEQQWKQGKTEKEEAIRKTTRLNSQAHWQHSVKPNSQWMTQWCLTTSTKKMVATLTNVVFVGRLKAEAGQPTQLKPMMDIFDLKYQMQDSQSPCLFPF